MTDEKTYVRDEEALAAIKKHAHPKLEGLPDYGLASLDAETEVFCQKLCEENGLNYLEVRDSFEAGRQVIQARQSNPINMHLLDKGVVPTNSLDNFFKGYVHGCINYERRRKKQ